MKNPHVAAVIAAASISTMSVAETLTVCASGCGYTSIVAAIDAATNGDVIQLSAQTYAESGTIDLHGKAITIRGTTDSSGMPNSVLVGSRFHGVMKCVTNEGPSTVLENLRLQGGHASNSSGGGGGLLLKSASPTIVNCTFADNQAGFDGGGIYFDNSSATLSSCRISGNSAGNNGGGLYCNPFSSPTLTNCSITDNVASGQGGGMYDNTGSRPTLNGCTVSGNTPNGIVHPGSAGADGVHSYVPVMLVDSIVCGNGDGKVSSQLVGAAHHSGETHIHEQCLLNAELGDVDRNGVVDAVDWRLLGELLGICLGDLDGNGQIDGTDLSMQIGAWGECP